MEKKTETTLVYWGFRGDNGKEKWKLQGLLGLGFQGVGFRV